MRRKLLQALFGVTAGIYGQPPPRRPDQHIPVGWPGALPAPQAVIIGRTVLVFGPTGTIVGVFVYAPGTTPASGNPPTEWMTESTKDPFGNVLASPGAGSRSGGQASVLHSGTFTSYTAPTINGPWTSRFLINTTVGSTAIEGIASNQSINLVPGANGTIQTTQGLSIGGGATPQALVNGSTINTAGITMQPVTCPASVTGIIMQPGTFDGQMMAVQSEAGAGVTITFAASATSNVSGGVAAVIQPGSTGLFFWVAATALWYPVVSV